MVKLQTTLLVLALSAVTASAQFTWSDGFEAYVPGTLCPLPGCGNAAGSGGWTGWDNVAGAAGTVVDPFTAVPAVVPHTGNHCVQIGVATDCIQPFSLNYPTTYPQSGLYEISAWSYVPTGGLTGTTWFIVNNQYNHLGPYSWTLQLQFTTGGIVTDVNRGGSVPVVFDQWVQIRVLADLTNNTMIATYNGATVSTGVWNILGGALAIANIDLYTGGTIFYDDISVQNPPANYQVNSAPATFTVNGINGTPYNKAVANLVATNCSLGSANVALSSSNPGNAWDLAITVGPGVPVTAGGFYTGGGQIVNINVFDPTLSFLNGLTFAVPFANFTLPLQLSAPFDVSAQMIILDALSPDGFTLSQLNEIHVVNGVASAAGPTGDDTAVVINLPGSLCASSIPFYGINYSSLGVITNGRVMFGTATPSTSFTPSAAAGMTDFPWVGVWCDLNQGAGGSINVTSPAAGIVRVDWAAVPYFATAIPNTFGIQFDTTTGQVTIDGLGGIAANAGNQMIGVSPGNLGSTDPGSQTFAVGGPFTVQYVTDMIYAFGQRGTLTPGMTNLQFFPSGNGYIWFGN